LYKLIFVKFYAEGSVAMLAREIRYHIHDLCSPIFLYEMRLKSRCMILLGHSFHALIETNGFLFKNCRDFSKLDMHLQKRLF